MTLEITTGGRLHFGLVDLTGATPRRFGGIGAILEGPRMRVRANCAPRTEVMGLEHDSTLRDRVLSRLQAFEDLTGSSPMSITLDSVLPRHHGLGSGTAVVLSCLAAANALNGDPLSKQDLIHLSGRGGASGTGVNGYWQGGWIIDAGQRAAEALPSGSQSPEAPSLLISRIAPPPWVLDVFLPPGSTFSGAEEVAIFRLAAKGARSETLEALAELHHGLVPALVQQDLDAFGAHMREFQSKSLKKFEIAAQASAVRNLMEELSLEYPCVAMSSMGPAVVGIREQHADLPDPAGRVPLFSTTVSTKGADYKWVE